MILPIKNLTIDQLDGYPADTGEDFGVPVGTPVYACADGTIIYSEKGHTPWTTPPDTPNSILLKFKTPVYVNGKNWLYAWYTHLSELAFQVPDDGAHYKEVKEGTYLGKTGNGNLVPHLHFGLLTNRQQAEGDYMPEKVLHRYLMSLLTGQSQNQQPAKRFAKLFFHDGKAMLVVDGKFAEVKSIKMEVEL